MIFDQRLTWNQHINATAIKCRKIIIILRCLSGTKWDASSDQLIYLYEALIRSRIDYDSQVLESASVCHKKKLDQIQYSALRVCLGIPMTSPTSALQVESGQFPLDLWRSQLSANVYLKTVSINNSILNKEVDTSWKRIRFKTTFLKDKFHPFVKRVKSAPLFQAPKPNNCPQTATLHGSCKNPPSVT